MNGTLDEIVGEVFKAADIDEAHGAWYSFSGGCYPHVYECIPHMKVLGESTILSTQLSLGIDPSPSDDPDSLDSVGVVHLYVVWDERADEGREWRDEAFAVMLGLLFTDKIVQHLKSRSTGTLELSITRTGSEEEVP